MRRHNTVINFKNKVLELESRGGIVRVGFQNIGTGVRLIGVRMVQTMEEEEDTGEHLGRI